MGKTKTVMLSGEPEEKKKKAPGLETPPEEPKEGKAEEKKAKETAGEPKVRGKKYQEARAKIDKTKVYSLDQAIKLLKETSYASFDATLELHAVVKKAGLNTNVTLPHSTGKKKKIEVASEDTVKKLKEGKIDFDVLLATAEMMPKLVPFAKLLGPKGLMPNPKTGTLIKNKNEAEKFSNDTLTIKTEKKAPLVHIVVGKISQGEKELEENIKKVASVIGEKQITKTYLTSTMGPSVKVSLA